ncbi:MAG: signal peptidase I [Clostridiales bacterium]|nr:signal peptidase I [Clostridiales bacterium]
MQEKRRTVYFVEIWQWVQAILLAVVIALLIRGFVFEPVYVDGESMENTLRTSQRLIVSKMGYYFHAPQRGDVVVLQYEEGITGRIPLLRNLPIFKKAITSISEVDFIKRVVAVPGDRLDIRGDGFVYINDVKLNEPYIKEQGKTFPYSVQFPLTVPPGYVFVMGDNRENSKDSRIIGLIGYDRIKGRAAFRIWPFSSIGSIYK